jgi:hypothetical protein
MECHWVTSTWFKHVSERNTQHFLQTCIFWLPEILKSNILLTTHLCLILFLSKANSHSSLLRCESMNCQQTFGLPVASTTVCSFVHVVRYWMSFKSRSHTMLDLTYTTIHGDADSKFNHSPGMDPKFDQISRTRQGGSLRQGCQSDRGRVAVVPHTAVAQPRHK